MLSRRPSRPSPLAGPALSSDGQEDGEEQDVYCPSKTNANCASSALSASLPFPAARSREISRRASMPPSILITNSSHGIGDQRPRDRRGNGVEETATARKQPSRVIYMDDLKRNQRRPHSMADSLPVAYRPRSSQPRPRPVSDLLMPTAVSQSKGIYCSSSMTVMDGSNSFMRTLIDAYGGAPSQSTITLLDSPSATRADNNLSRSSSMNMLKSTDSSLRKGVPSSDRLRVPMLDRRHSLMLPSRGEIKPRPGSYGAPRPQSASTLWSSSDSFQNQMTPTFTRQGLSGAGVVLPLTVKEYQRQQKMKDREGRPTRNEPSFPGIRRLRTRHSDAGHGRTSGIRSKRGSIYVLPSVASVFSAELLRDGGEKDVEGHDGITRLEAQVEDLVQALEKRSTEVQDHADRCKHDEAATMVTAEDAQPPLTKARKRRAGPVSACRRYFTAIFVRVRSSKPGSSEISGESTGSKARTIKAIFSNIIIRK